MNTYTPQEIQEILTKHQLWLEGEEGGERAKLTGVILAGTYLAGVNLAGADLARADLAGATFVCADFTGARLTGADLTGVNFTRAILEGVIGNGREIKSMQLGTYSITYTAQVLQIGCRQYPIADWWDFTDEQILDMDGQEALDWWNKYKDHIRATIELSPATPTGKEKS
jgi:uncharacterized protein YjbI with pentapeptide repeats